MKRFIPLSAAIVSAIAGSVYAQPIITSLGGGTPNSVAQQGGTVVVGGAGLSGTAAARWTLSAGSLSTFSIAGTTGGGLMSADGSFSTATVINDVSPIVGNTAAGVTPAFSLTPTLVPAVNQPATTETCGARYIAGAGTIQRLGGLPIAPDLMVYGSGSNGSSTGTFQAPHGISSNGRFIVGQAYVSSYSSSAGATISASTFNWRPYVWDAQGNAGAGSITVLPTPFRTTSNTWRRRTGNAYAVSADGSVIVGAQEHNSSTLAGADPDGGRLVVWRLNAGNYEMSFLPNGLDAGGLNQTYSTTPGTVILNSTGTIIVGRAVDTTGSLYLGKWIWNSGTSSWDAPINIGSDLTTPASWLPDIVVNCPIPPSITPTGMTEDGNTIVGTVVYSTCGSFMSGGFIQSGNGPIQDWYDYLLAANVAGITENYGPTGDLGDPTRGLPKLGFPSAISSDGNVITGFQGGTQRIPGALPWVVQVTGGVSCVAPVITLNPSNVNFSRCSVGSTLSTVILNASAAGSGPFTYQWSRNGVPVTDGATVNGSTITGATTFQMRIAKPMPADAGSYTCTITGCNGLSATTTASTVAPDAAIPTPANDTCAGALNIGEGTTSFNICGAYGDDGFACNAAEQADIWFRYTPTFTGSARFQTCGSSFDSSLAIFQDCNGAQLACNNDVGSRGIVGVTCNAVRSMVDLAVVSGQPILVRVGALTTNATGALTISATPAAAPNDLCSNAVDIGMGTTNSPAAAFNFAEATEDYTFGTDFCGGGSSTASTRDVWFRLVTPCGGTYTIDTCGSTNTNPVIHVFDACFGNVIACNDNVGTAAGCTSNQARVSNLAITGNVWIRVASSNTNAPTSGSFQLTVTGTPTPCCGTSDYNGDNDFGTDADIEAFFACLGGTCCPTCFFGGSDFNGDGDFGTDQDIEAFFRVLAGGNC